MDRDANMARASTRFFLINVLIWLDYFIVVYTIFQNKIRTAILLIFLIQNWKLANYLLTKHEVQVHNYKSIDFMLNL